MKETTCSTFTADIFIGLQEGYDGPLHSLSEVVQVCQGYVDEVGLGVTVTEITFVYTGGKEPGAIVGLINYPRFPKYIEDIRRHAVQIATLLMSHLHQIRCSIVCSDGQTIMLESASE